MKLRQSYRPRVQRLVKQFRICLDKSYAQCAYWSLNLFELNTFRQRSAPSENTKISLVVLQNVQYLFKLISRRCFGEDAKECELQRFLSHVHSHCSTH